MCVGCLDVGGSALYLLHNGIVSKNMRRYMRRGTPRVHPLLSRMLKVLRIRPHGHRVCGNTAVSQTEAPEPAAVLPLKAMLCSWAHMGHRAGCMFYVFMFNVDRRQGKTQHTPAACATSLFFQATTSCCRLNATVKAARPRAINKPGATPAPCQDLPR